jgi:hypothetical protein
MSFDDVQIMLKDFSLKSDVHYLMSQKVSMDELRMVVDEKVGVRELEADFLSI